MMTPRNNRAACLALNLARRCGLERLSLQLYVLLAELVLLARHWGALWRSRRFRGSRGLKLNLGCGYNVRQGWVNVDSRRAADLQLDLRKRLPFADGSCAVVYSEHLLEHLDYPNDTMRHLRECCRVLHGGGTLSLGVPDAEGPLLFYAATRQDSSFAEQARQLPAWENHPAHVRTPLERINFLFRQNTFFAFHEHRHAYDFETLQMYMTEAGFEAISRRAFDPDLDSPSRRSGTLYVVATKPAVPAPTARRGLRRGSAAGCASPDIGARQER